MKNTKLTTTLLGLLILTGMITSACTDFLSIRPKDALYPKTVTDFENLLNYGELTKTGASFPAFLTDDAFFPDDPEGLPQWTPTLTTLYEQSTYDLYTLSHKNVFTDAEEDACWTSAYANIFYYNIVIDNILDAVDGTESKKQEILAEAKAGRALEYLNLVNCYSPQYDPATASEAQSGVPLILQGDILMEDLTRATVQECYDQILRDLTEALPKLPEKARPTKYRISRGGGAGLLARAYLIIGDYEKSLQYANEALKSNSDLLDFKTITELNPFGFMGRTSMPLALDDPEAILIRNAPYVYGNSGSVLASRSLLSSYDQEKDKRMMVYFVNNIWGDPLPTPEYQFYSTGYKENVGISSVEMYLTAAECEARIGSTDRAMELVNKVRTHRIVDYTPVTGLTDRDAVLQEVLLERRREFALRGMFRFIDLRRLSERELGESFAVTHNVGGGKTESMMLGDPRFVISIPNKILRFNPNMKQNNR